MRTTSKLLIACLAAVSLPWFSHAAPVSWGTWTAVADNTAIQLLGGYTTYGGVNFNGSTTTIHNGSKDVSFTGIGLNSSDSAAGITVGTSGFDFQSTGGGNSNVVSAVGSPQSWGTALDRVIGDFGSGAAATFTLSGLTTGSSYYVQFFSSAPDANILSNSILTSGGGDSPAFGSHSGGDTKYIIATFTADDTSQAFTISGSEPTYSALVIGVQPAGSDTTPPAWTATWPQVDKLSSTSLTVRAKTNEAGKAFYVVLPDGAPAPTAAQVKAGTDSSNIPVSASGNMILTANTEATTTVGSLTPSTAYDVYLVAEDAVPNLQAAPVLVNVSLVSPAVVSWGGWTDVSDETAIQTPGGYTYGGVNFNGSDTTIGSIAFTGIAQNASGATNGVTVSTTGFAFQSTGSGNSNVVSAVGSPQTWATVLDRVIGDFDNSASIDLTGLTPGTAYTVQFFSSAPDANILGNSKITSGGADSPFFGNHVSGGTKYIIATFTANSTSQSFPISGTEPTYSALVIGAESTNTFANWIGGFTGLNGLTGFDDDADSDGLANGLENFLGTAPNKGNAGLTAGTLSGNTFTFTHPQNATPASDLPAPAYNWSTDLASWNASGAPAGGTTVVLAPSINTPSAGTTTITATVAGTVPLKLFVRLSVSQN